MPTMVAVARAAGWPASATRRPTASAVPNICRAVNSLTMRTRGAPGPSRSSKPRPRRISTPSVRKIDGVAATAVTMRGGVSAAPACSAGAIERRSALDTPKGSPPASDADSIEGWPRTRRADDRASAARAPSLHSGPSRLRTATPDPIQIDAGVVPRFRDRVLHEHRRDDEEPCRDRDLPPQQGVLAPGGAAARGSIRRRARRARRSCASAGSPARGRRRPAPRGVIDTATPNAVTFSTG